MSQSDHYQYPDAYGNVSPVHSQPQQPFYDPYEPQQAYKSVPLSHTDNYPEHAHNTYETHPTDMSEANHYQRPLSAASGVAVGAAATSGTYWSPHGGERSPGSHLDEAAWEGGYDENKPFLQRKRTIIGLVLLALVGLGVALGVGLGVGLKKNSSATQSDEARLSSIASASSKSSADEAASRSAAQTTVILGRRSDYHTLGDKRNNIDNDSYNNDASGSRNHDSGRNYDSGGGNHYHRACSDNDQRSNRAHVRHFPARLSIPRPSFPTVRLLETTPPQCSRALRKAGSWVSLIC
ncbi:BZ3500_MvSof-1268-A1-R1_Chr10-2g02911 [Microbotryum saponariae]|uniref:BZ3500_MvSof-1268-A1-R1_Chr10-2g02911 protein n=1 Tax=Microbotryum saponariae TaxID=289078 RepID=A0A2X0KAD2_9BASI|nr:BZ3501_MvSof-1269-A2-R1_Chr10-2g02497 [Microbotryum saponariae]SDA01725.1 BZ3500_MvSof-1268-A1-R1_Chr10-2g02911 [Microbotryum saponariae]